MIGVAESFLSGVLLTIIGWYSLVPIPFHAPSGEQAAKFPRPHWLPEGINWVVTGETGAGKSGLVNGLRGLNKSHPRAAPEGMTETTTERQQHILVQHPHIAIWDMPGHGTAKVPMQTYIQDFGLRHFHGVIICIKDGRVLEDNINMVMKLQEYDVPFYVVQNRFFTALRDDVEEEYSDARSRMHDLAFVQEKAHEVAKAIHAGFQAGGVQVDINRVFLICSRKLQWAQGARFSDCLEHDIQLMSKKVQRMDGCKETFFKIPRKDGCKETFSKIPSCPNPVATTLRNSEFQKPAVKGPSKSLFLTALDHVKFSSL